MPHIASVRRKLFLLYGAAAMVAATLLAAALGPAGDIKPLGNADEGAGTGDIVQKFTAESGDMCKMGDTEGNFGWRAGFHSVKVAGTLTDRVSGTGLDCRDDGRDSTATFVAYVGTTQVASESVSADNSVREFTFELVAQQPIERIVVQVCRRTTPAGPGDYCGPPRELRQPTP